MKKSAVRILFPADVCYTECRISAKLQKWSDFDMKYILKGGTVVGGSVSQRADLLIDGEKIAAVGENLCVEGAQVVDVTGKLLFPGFIDYIRHPQRDLRRYDDVHSLCVSQQGRDARLRAVDVA